MVLWSRRGASPRRAWVLVPPIVLALSGVLVSFGLPGGAPLAPPPVAAVGERTPSIESTGVRISLAPGSWTMVAGASVSVAGGIVGVPEGCDASLETLEWSLPNGSAFQGTLNTSSGPVVRFSSFPSAGGNATVQAVATGTLSCAGSTAAWTVDASSAILLRPTERVSDFTVEPNPTAPGNRVVLDWSVSGGVPPYVVNASFGDGSGSTFTQSDPGYAYTAHYYRAGAYHPELRISDSTGAAVPCSPSTPLLVADGLAAEIWVPSSSVDVGLPFLLRANISGGIGPYAESWKDSLGSSTAGSGWNLSAPAAGNLSVELTVTDLIGDSVTAKASLRVVSAPSVALLGASAGTDLGSTFPVDVQVDGGVAPFELNWTTSPGGSTGSSQLPADGSYAEPIVASSVGELWVSAEVVDAVGAVRSISAPITQVYPAPRLSVLSAPSVADVGFPLALTAAVVGGAPPLNWSVTSSAPLANSSGNSGALSGPGTITWHGTLAEAGPAVWFLQVVDRAGAILFSNGSLRVADPPTMRLTVPTGVLSPGRPIAVGASWAGGVPPYVYTLWMSDLESASGNSSRAGSVVWNATPLSTGQFEVRARVLDAVGVVADAAASLPVNLSLAPILPQPTATGPAAMAPAPGSSVGGWALGVVGLGVAAAVYLLPRWRRRSRVAPVGEEDRRALGVMRRLLQENDSLERQTLYYLAEEEGVGAAASAGAVDRWYRAGRVRVEVGLEGQDLLTWVEQEPVTSSARPTPSADAEEDP